MSSQWSWFVAIQAVKTFPFQSVTVSNILHPIYTTPRQSMRGNFIFQMSDCSVPTDPDKAQLTFLLKISVINTNKN